MITKLAPNSKIDCKHMGALMQAIASADIFVLYQTPDLVYQWAENLPSFLRNKWQSSGRDRELFDLETIDNIDTAKIQALATGKRQSLEVSVKNHDQPIWYRLSIDCHRDDQNTIVGLITTGVNVSELRRREQVLKVLLREVSHRSKNLLAIIQSIATQTARYSQTVAVFLRKFQGRLQSLSQSQDLVTNSNWRGAGFKELIRSQTAAYLDFDKKHFNIIGQDDPYLFPGAALHVGLAVHELLINSFSFGALSQENGSITVSCAIAHKSDDELTLTMQWHEKFDPLPSSPQGSEASFGSIVLEKVVPMSVCGTASYHITNDEVVYQLTMPTSQFDLYSQTL